MVFHHGELREAGTHNQLLGRRGLYWRLYQLQYSEEKIKGQIDVDFGRVNPPTGSAVAADN